MLRGVVKSRSCSRGWEELQPFELGVIARSVAKQDSASRERFLGVVHSRIPELNNGDVTALVQGLSTFKAHGKKPGVYSALADVVVKTATCFTSKELSRLANGFASARFPSLEHPVFQAISDASLERLEEFDGSHVVQLLNSFTRLKLGQGSEGIVAAFAPSVNAWAQELYPSELANAINAYARTIVWSPELFATLAERVHSDRHSFCALSLTSVVNAFAKVTAPATLDVLSDLAECVPPLLPDFKPHYFAVCAWAYAKSRHPRARDLLDVFAVQLCEGGADGSPQDRLAKLQGKELVNLMSAYALMGVRPKQLIETVVDLWSTRRDLVEGYSPTDLMFAASSLSKLQVRDARVFASIGDVAVCRHHELTTKQAVFMLHAFAKAQAVMPTVFVGLAECLRRGLDGRGSVSKSDWVVAVSAYVNTSLHAHEAIVTLYSDMVDRCVGRTGDADMKISDKLSALDTSMLLRALAAGWASCPTPHVAETLVSRLMLKHSDFNTTELLVASHAVAVLSVEHEAVPRYHLQELLSVLSEEMDSGRLANLGPADLITAVGLFARAQHVDMHIWGRIAEQIECAVDRGIEREAVQLTHCVVAALSAFSRVSVRDDRLFYATCRLIAQMPDQLDNPRVSFVVASLAKLDFSCPVGSHTLCGKAWGRLVLWARTGSRDPLLLLGLGHVLAGTHLPQFQKQVRATLLLLLASGENDTPMVRDTIGSSQVMTALQCFAAEDLEVCSSQELMALTSLFKEVSLGLVSRASSPRTPTETSLTFASEVTDLVESLLLLPAQDIDRSNLSLRTEEVAVQYSLDILLKSHLLPQVVA